MRFHPIMAVLSVIFGLLVIVYSHLLSYIVGVFFILLGAWIFIDHYFSKGPAPARTTKKSKDSK